MRYNALRNIFELLFLPLYLVMPVPAIASVSVLDEYQVASDASAVGHYAAMVMSSLNTLSQTSDQVRQVTQLDDLMTKEQQLADECNKYCDLATAQRLNAELHSVNNKIVQNFNKFSGMVSQSINNIDDIKSLLMSSTSVVGVKEATLSIQRSAAATQRETHATLMQIESLLINQHAENEVHDLQAHQETNSIYQGFGNEAL